jgi:hypothetical protein
MTPLPYTQFSWFARGKMGWAIRSIEPYFIWLLFVSLLILFRSGLCGAVLYDFLTKKCSQGGLSSI